MVFEWLYKNSGSNPELPKIHGSLIDKVELGEIKDILTKLRNDKLIYTEVGGNRNAEYFDHAHFLISFDGKYFYETVGSFAEKIRRENQKRLNEDLRIADEQALNQRMERNEVTLTSWTKKLNYATMAAAVLIVLWDAYKTFCLHLR